MALLKNVEIGWKALGGLLNDIIDVVNSLQPIAGSGINIEERANGTTYSLADQKGGGGGGDSSQTNAGGGGDHVLINGTIWHGVKWEQVTVVDPSTCAQSTITVMRFTGDYVNDSITIPFGNYAYWASPISGASQ